MLGRKVHARVHCILAQVPATFWPSAGVGKVLFREGVAYASVGAFAVPPFALDEVPALRKRAFDGGR